MQFILTLFPLEKYRKISWFMSYNKNCDALVSLYLYFPRMCGNLFILPNQAAVNKLASLKEAKLLCRNMAVKA